MQECRSSLRLKASDRSLGAGLTGSCEFETSMVCTERVSGQSGICNETISPNMKLNKETNKKDSEGEAGIAKSTFFSYRGLGSVPGTHSRGLTTVYTRVAHITHEYTRNSTGLLEAGVLLTADVNAFTEEAATGSSKSVVPPFSICVCLGMVPAQPKLSLACGVRR